MMIDIKIQRSISERSSSWATILTRHGMAWLGLEKTIFVLLLLNAANLHRRFHWNFQFNTTQNLPFQIGFGPFYIFKRPHFFYLTQGMSYLISLSPQLFKTIGYVVFSMQLCAFGKYFISISVLRPSFFLYYLLIAFVTSISRTLIGASDLITSLYNISLVSGLGNRRKKVTSVTCIWVNIEKAPWTFSNQAVL